ncbi:MAG TPA: uroporphyrinogen decarboxylase family protein [Candidatus Deferrimicrobium sp.]|nr:uroporphyrinogen decarboxylase family protein [Candidatus Deferrimicrobium sp.]
MDFRTQILRTFQRKKLDQIVWQPRIMLWYNSNMVSRKKPKFKSFQTALKIQDIAQRDRFVPKEYIGKNIIKIYEDLNASIRYCAETLSLPLFYERERGNRGIVRKSVRSKNGSIATKIDTPVGTITQCIKDGYTVEKWVKNIDDLKIIKYIIEGTDYIFDNSMFLTAEKQLGNLGIPQSYFFRSPYQRCVLEILGFERTTIFFRRYPREMETFIQFLEEWDRQNYPVILNSKVKILNLGENIDAYLSSPREFERYHIPYYEERVKWIHHAGKFCHIHMDGHIADLLPYLADLPFDGIEALTPKPQGDVSIDQLKDAVDNKILLDVIPATLFMPQFPEKRLIECVNTILEYFSPHLILGISDELPGNADGRRLKLISEIVSKFEV